MFSRLFVSDTKKNDHFKRKHAFNTIVRKPWRDIFTSNLSLICYTLLLTCF